MQLDFSNDLWIDTIVIHSESRLEITSITSPKISSINISGERVTISDLCIFSSNALLPSLKLVQINDSSLENVMQHQFCEKCDISQRSTRDLEV